MTGEIMKYDKIIKYTAKEAMALVVDYLKLESIQTIEILSLETLKICQKHNENEENSKKIEWNLENFDITIADSRAVLEAAGFTGQTLLEETLLKEAESQLFMKMFMRYLHRNHVKVFLLAENEAVLEDMKKNIFEYSSGIKIVETATMETHGISDDMILNLINGVEADCILADISTPLQQEFIMRNRMLINTKLWVGLGDQTLKKCKIKKLQKNEKYLEKMSNVLRKITNYFNKK